MVQVTNFHEVETKDGKTFISLELTGGLELIQSQTTGKMYATVRKCRIASTFDANVAKMMLGTQLDGDIVRVETDPYDYVNKRTGEVMSLQHSYSYRPKGSLELIGESRVQEIQMA
jgi:hypothetical protein